MGQSNHTQHISVMNKQVMFVGIAEFFRVLSESSGEC